MSELYIEEFSSPRINDQKVKVLLTENECFDQDEPKSVYSHFLELEKTIKNEYRRFQVVRPYLDDIRHAVEEGSVEKALMLTDELEELLDLEFSS